MHLGRLFRMTGFALATCLGLTLAAMAWGAPVTANASSRVSVTYQNPQQFTEARKSRPFAGRHDDDYLKPLKAYFEKRGEKILAPGQRLDIVITDVDLAGDFEPWRGPEYAHVRIIRDIYPPRIDLKFKLIGADGQVLREGTRSLRDLAFLTHSGPPGDTDPLRFEKHMIARWLAKGADGI